MSRIADESTLDLITDILSKHISLSSKYNEYVYTNLIRSFIRKGIIDKFLSYGERLKSDPGIPRILKRDIVEACGSSGLKEACPLIVDLYFNSDGHSGIKIACMRALGRLECQGYGGVITSALFHDDWRIRAQAAQAVLSSGESAIPHLQNLLYDEFYYVRINAAKSLSKLGADGLSLLESEMNSDDPFVRDTVRFILRK
jgi:HEAT repeat protein